VINQLAYFFLESRICIEATPFSLLANFSSSTPLIVVGAGTEQYTQDGAVIDIDASKIDTSRIEPRSMIFPVEGNIIDLGSKFLPEVLTRTADASEPRNSHNFDPADCLLSLRCIITDEEMHNPTMYNQRNDRCIMVGRTTGPTVRRARDTARVGTSASVRNDIIHSYFGSISGIFREWAIQPFDKKLAHSQQ
jgi:hypothetical protein